MRQRQDSAHFADVVVADFYGFRYVVFVEIFQNCLCTFGVAGGGFYFEEDALVILTDYKIKRFFSGLFFQSQSVCSIFLCNILLIKCLTFFQGTFCPKLTFFQGTFRGKVTFFQGTLQMIH